MKFSGLKSGRFIGHSCAPIFSTQLTSFRAGSERFCQLHAHFLILREFWIAFCKTQLLSIGTWWLFTCAKLIFCIISSIHSNCYTFFKNRRAPVIHFEKKTHCPSLVHLFNENSGLINFGDFPKTFKFFVTKHLN